MIEIIRSMGAVKLFEQLRKHYRAMVGMGFPRRPILLHRRFRTWTQAENYGMRFVQRWEKLHQENKTLAKKGRRFS